MASPILLLVAGILLVIVGASALVRGAADLASALGTPPLIIGLTVVAFGTSSPELVVSLQAALHGKAEVALGNVIGSNIFNVLFILGASAIIAPLVVSAQVVRQDVPIMILVSVGVLALAAQGGIGRGEGALLIGALLAYTVLQIRLARRSRKRVAVPVGRGAEAEVPAAPQHRGKKYWVVSLLLVAGGLTMLTVGSRWLIGGAAEIATGFGISELVVGLTIVAAGTSMPEVATSIAASLRREHDIAVGNVVGSNIFNVLLVLGGAALITPGGMTVPTEALVFDMPIMIAVSIACLPIFFTGHEIDRWEGAIFLLYYLAYTAFLVLSATQHSALPVFSNVVLIFVVPLTLITLAVISVRAWRKGRVRQDS
ncbi:MAG: calcium/sodium antiporter [Longimicrobiales bacterium]